MMDSDRSPTTDSTPESTKESSPGPSKRKSPRKSPPARPSGPRDNTASRDQAGSRRTMVFSTSSSQPQPGDLDAPDTPRLPRKELPEDTTMSHSGADEDTGTSVTVTAASDIDLDPDPPHAPYRPPEVVIEPEEEHPPGFVPGVIAEHLDDDDMSSPPDSRATPDNGQDAFFSSDSRTGSSNVFDDWGAQPNHVDMDMDFMQDTTFVEDRKIGPGVFPRRWLRVAHPHELIQPTIKEGTRPLQQPLTPQKPPIRSDSHGEPTDETSTAETGDPMSPGPKPRPASTHLHFPLATVSDIWEACPGGVDNHKEWYFCVTCWGWIRIVTARGEFPDVADMEQWWADAQVSHPELSFEDNKSKETLRAEEWKNFQELEFARSRAPETHHHLHPFHHLIDPTDEVKLERVHVDDTLNAFPHEHVGMEEEQRWKEVPTLGHSATLYESCSSDMWIFVDKMVPGQLPAGLVEAFTIEKTENPNIQKSPNESVQEAWNWLATLLSNPLFRGQRGWVKLDNKTFLRYIGTTILTSHLLYHFGFGCRQEEDHLQIGPFSQGDQMSEQDAHQMERYMLRTWVEINMYLQAYQLRNDLTPAVPSKPPLFTVDINKMENLLGPALELYPPRVKVPYPDSVIDALHTLGVTTVDNARAVGIAYTLQIMDDSDRSKEYLTALDVVASAPRTGQENLQLQAATQRSLGRYTISDVEAAYDRIGYNSHHASDIGVEAADAPDSYILTRHRDAIHAASRDPAERSAIHRALQIIGLERKSEQLQEFGKEGKIFMSVDDAYAELSAPKDSIDDGLIMQYDMAVNEFPSKTAHYRECLDIIANAPGQERPGIKRYLETGQLEPIAPPRKDIPVGLQNIGNTCYLNSILQYMYSIKPLREAVMHFEQAGLGSETPQKPEVGRSRRFVRELRLLFNQLYESENSSVRPEEALAYLAITRPEIDQVLEPEPTIIGGSKRILLDDIPTIPSPSSTRVATPDESPSHQDLLMSSRPSSPVPDASPKTPGGERNRSEGSMSILGKRASEDRDDSPRSSVGHVRARSDALEPISQTESPTEDDEQEEEGYFSLIPKGSAESADVLEAISSPTPAPDLQALRLEGNDEETKDDDSLTQFEERHDNESKTRAEERLEYAPPVSVPPPLPTRPQAARKDTLASGLKFGLQQDSAEVLINVLGQLEMGLDPASQDQSSSSDEKSPNLIQRLFSCKFHQQLFYETVSGNMEAQTPVESVFVHPIIGVEEEGKDLYDCLAELYLGGADIEYEGKKGYMMDLMDQFPPMLYIQMRRSQYDMATGRERKLNTHIAFEQTLSMDRFLVNADKAKRDKSIDITRDMIRTRSRLHELRNHKPLSIPDTFTHVREAFSALDPVEYSDLELAPDFLQALGTEGEEVASEITQLEDKLPLLKSSLEDLWKDEKMFEYELVAVFMHRGRTSGAGHYWTYQTHLPNHSDEFFKYNDETVTVVPQSEVLQDRTGSDANPALLCYVRKDQNLIDTLHRRILEVEEEAHEPAETGLLD